MKYQHFSSSRRSFLSKTAMASAMFPFANSVLGENTLFGQQEFPEIHIFSKHLQFLDYNHMAAKAAELNFDGVDLTVRPGGHVLPENVTSDLPKAINAIRKAGIKADLITTAVDDANDETDRQVLSVAADHEVKFYRMNWFRYAEDKTIPESIDQNKKVISKLSHLNEKLGLIGCYQNHAGTMMGASLWELYELLSNAEQDHMGVQYDIRHATVEGGLSWERGLQLIHPRIKTIVIKDFKWVQQNGEWKVLNTPVGEGMVDFKKYFRLLKKYKINVPVSLHLEYPIGGAEHGASQLTVDKNVVFEAMKKDLQTIKKLWKDA